MELNVRFINTAIFLAEGLSARSDSEWHGSGRKWQCCCSLNKSGLTQWKTGGEKAESWPSLSLYQDLLKELLSFQDVPLCGDPSL